MSDRAISFTVVGEPKPAGSKKGFVNPQNGRVVITDSSGSKGKAWRRLVQEVAAEAMDGREPLTGELEVSMTFYRPRPKSHYRTGRNAHLLRDAAPARPVTRPDVLKLARATEDAMTHIAYADDSQIVDEHLHKRYGTPARVEVVITQRDNETKETR